MLVKMDGYYSLSKGVIEYPPVFILNTFRSYNNIILKELESGAGVYYIPDKDCRFITP